MDSGRQTVIRYAVLGFLVAAVAVAGAPHITGTLPIAGNGEVVLVADDGMEVDVTGSPDISLESFASSLGGSVYVRTESGNATFSASGPAHATIHKDEIEGTWTNVSEVDASANTIQIDPADKSQVTVGQEIDSFAYTGTYGVDDGTADFVYAGTSGTSRVTITGVPASTTIGAVDADSGALLDVATSDSSGAITFDQLDNSEHVVVLQTGTGPTLSNADPTGDLAQEPTELAVNVSDGDFPGDTVTVEFSLDGSVVGTQTTSSDGTVTQSITAPEDGGDHTWTVDVSDEYGNTVNESYMFRIPAEIEVRQESAPHDLITGSDTDPTTVTARCFEDRETNPEIIERQTTDGNFSLAGYPTGTQFACAIEAPGYHNRTVIIDSIYEQDTAFLVDKTETTVENRFVVNDRTGRFNPAQTEIFVQAAINESLYTTGTYTWLTVSGDDLGADEAFVTDLIEENRYRILVRNERGDTRVLGSYSAETTGTIELNIGSLDPEFEGDSGVAMNASWHNATDGNETVRVEYNDTRGATDTLYVNIYERGNESNVLVDNQSFAGPFGEFSYSKAVPAEDNETTWVVEVVADRGTADDGEAVANVRFQRFAGPQINVLTDLPQWLVTMIFGGVIFAVAGLFSQVNGHVGGVVVAGLGGMMWFVGLAPGYLGVGVVTLSLLTAGILFLRGSGGGF